MNFKHILLVEDNEGDIILTTEVLEESGIAKKISVARDGMEAIQFLTRTGAFTNVEVPDLILLDINLPKKNGFEVLKFIKENDAIKHLPVIMLTTSSSDTDIEIAYKNYANSFVTKPTQLSDFMEAILKIEAFWLNTAAYPRR